MTNDPQLLSTLGGDSPERDSSPSAWGDDNTSVTSRVPPSHFAESAPHYPLHCTDKHAETQKDKAICPKTQLRNFSEPDGCLPATWLSQESPGMTALLERILPRIFRKHSPSDPIGCVQAQL